jgi:hypothetical protein
VILKFTARARASIRDERLWWEQHRDRAPQLFRDELADAIRKIRRGTDAARRPYRTRDGQMAWLLLMPKTRHHLVYVTHGTVVEVVGVWNAQGEAAPRL